MNKPLRILLVNAVNPNVEVETRYPNLGLGYLVSSVRKNLPQANIKFHIANSNIPATAAIFRPHLVGISSVSQNFNHAKQYADFFAGQGIPVILGGVHCTALPGNLPESATAACLGESEITFVELVKAFLEDAFTPKHLHTIPGIAYRDKNVLKLTEKREQISNLDTIPTPARDLLDIRPHTYMFTSRGCPYRCRFCSSSRFWQKLRFFSAEYVVDEIALLIRDYAVSMISFFDDLFVANQSRLEEILRLLEKRRLLGKVHFTCSCRANVVTPDLAAILARMNIVSVGMGLESGDEETLRFLKGGTLNVEHNRTAIEHLKNAGIRANASFVIGSPRETREQIMRTYEFIKTSRLDLFDVYLLTPYPGTPVWDDAKAKGIVSDSMSDWSCLDVNVYRSPEKAIILSEILSRKEIIGLYNKFRRLRLRRNLIKVWNHPMRRDLPRMAWNLTKERVSDFLKKRKTSASKP